MLRSERRMLITPAKCLGLISLSAALGCNSAPQPAGAPPDTRAAEAAAVQKIDMDWSAAAQSKKVDDWVAFYSDDAVVLPPNESEATSQDAIRKSVGDLLALPGLSLAWKPEKVEAARSGDIAYVYGTYDLSMKGPKGKSVTDHGKYLEVWKKQPAGGWKCAVDTWNSDLPPTK